jgi:hypothetical protein
MENNERDRKLEQWLDEALSDYSAAEPRFGLEQRVLNRVRAEEKARRRHWGLWKWMPAFAAIAAVAIVGVAIRPVATRKAQPAQMSGGDLYSSSQQSERQVDKGSVDRLEAGPAKKAIAKKEMDTRARNKVAPRAEVPAEQTIDGRARNSDRFAFSVAANAPVSAPPPPPPPPQPGLGGAAMGGSVNLPGSKAVTQRRDAATAQNASEFDTKGSPVPMDPSAAAGQKLEEIPLQTVPLTSSTKELKDAAASAPSGIIGTETVAVAKESAALKKVKSKKKEQEQAAKARAEDANVIDVFGMRLRTDIKQAPAGPMQFPTPSPLSEQERLVLAAAKSLKDLPPKQASQGDAIPPVEIKEVQIAPLAGPRK